MGVFCVLSLQVNFHHHFSASTTAMASFKWLAQWASFWTKRSRKLPATQAWWASFYTFTQARRVLFEKVCLHKAWMLFHQSLYQLLAQSHAEGRVRALEGMTLSRCVNKIIRVHRFSTMNNDSALWFCKYIGLRQYANGIVEESRRHTLYPKRF